MKTISKLLALETTDVSGSVALCEEGRIVERRFLDPLRRSAQTLAPAIQALLNDRGWRPSDVDVVGVAVGPGSFTGLRVGVATAKMFAWATNAQIIGVDSLDVVAGLCLRSENIETTGVGAIVLSVGIDAQRGDAAVRNYLVAEGTAVPLDERFHVVSIKRWLGTDDSSLWEKSLDDDSREEWESALARMSTETVETLRRATLRDVVFAGPALRRVKDLASIRPFLRLAPDELWTPDAAGVAFAAWNRAVSGSFDDAWSILPVYSRRAAAEEKALAKASSR